MVFFPLVVKEDLGVVPFGCEGRPGGIQGVVPFGCEGRPGVVSRVLFPSVVKEDLVWYPGCCSLRVSSRLIFKDPFTPPLGSSTGQQVVSERVSSTKKGSNDLKSKDPWQPK
ncbi:hypothetical protein Taro_029218, partial [Colocasia esculenta]|nr:hypothetical protein [Colocasia esculenta]